MLFGALLIPGLIAYCVPLLAPDRRWLTAVAVLGFAYLAYGWLDVSRNELDYAMPGLVHARLLIQSQSFGVGVLVRSIQFATARRSPLGSGLPFTLAGAVINLAVVLLLLRSAL